MSAPWALRGRLLAICFLVVAVTPRLAAQVARITVDSAYDKFRDAAPRVYVRLSRLPTSLSGLSLRLIHERCGKGLFQASEPGHTLVFDLDSARVPSLVSLARERAMVGFLEFAAPDGRHGTWEQLIYSEVIKGTNGTTYVAVGQRNIAESSLRRFLLDRPEITFRLSINSSDGVEFTVPHATQAGVEEFLAAAGAADAACPGLVAPAAAPHVASATTSYVGPASILPSELRPPPLASSAARSYFDSRSDVRQGCAIELERDVRSYGAPIEIGHTGDSAATGYWTSLTLTFGLDMRRGYEVDRRDGRCLVE